jgi:hypothetical protein
MVLLGEIEKSEVPKLLEATVETGIPIGRILVICRRLSEDELQARLTAANLVLSGALSSHKAAILLAYSYIWQVPFDNVCRRTEFTNSDTVVILLMASGFVETGKVLTLYQSMPDCRKLSGRDLYRAGLVSLYHWQEVMEQAVLLRQGELSLRQVLCMADDIEATGELPVVTCDLEEKVRLGQLLIQAGLLAEEDLLYALELSLESGQPLGAILVNRETITKFELKLILKLQSLIQCKSISSTDAVRYLRLVPQARCAQQQVQMAA